MPVLHEKGLPWSLSAIKGLQVGGVLEFAAPRAKHRSIRKQFSSYGVEHDCHFTVRIRNEQAIVKRMR